MPSREMTAIKAFVADISCDILDASLHYNTDNTSSPPQPIAPFLPAVVSTLARDGGCASPRKIANVGNKLTYRYIAQRGPRDAR